MKLSSIKINGAAIEQGAWVCDIPALPGVRLKVRGVGNNDYKRLEAKLIREVPRERRVFGLDPADAENIEAQCLAKTVLQDWAGIEDDAGEPVQFSEAQALGLLSDPDFLVFKNSVLYAGNMVTTAKREDAGVDAGN
jgi:hypothetical protein